MPLDIIVVGAGIAGLCTAVALNRAGHAVKVFEKSSFAGEVGAALVITPNGQRVLANLGFDFARARADPMNCFEVLDGQTFDPLNRTDLRNAREDFGAPFYTVHRVDLHEELMRLTSGLEIRLATKVVGANDDLTSVKLEDGSEHHADLIIAADGLHSSLRAAVLGEEQVATHLRAQMRAFRFMIPTAQLQDDRDFHELLECKGQGNSVLVDTSATTERHMVWYTCRNGQVQNFAGVYEKNEARDDAIDPKKLMLAEFGHYHPSLRQIIGMADDVTDWPLAYHDPLPHWQRGNIILIGDAAHPMLPFGAQGANQAIEDAGALAVVLGHDDAPQRNLMHRLTVFEKIRRLRASRVQIMSGVRLGKEKQVEDELRRYSESASFVPTSISERYRHDYSFDVMAAAQAALDV